MAVGSNFGGITFPRTSDALVLHLVVGLDLICFDVNRGDYSLREIHRLRLAAPVQYVWPHPSRSLLYVVSSNRSLSAADDQHALATVGIDERTGVMRLLSEVPLPTRPIHVTLDASAQYALVAYNAPALVTTHRIDAEGCAGESVIQRSEPRSGHFPHQVLMLPSGKAAVIVARGNHATLGRAEETGSLEFLSLHHGQLSNVVTVVPDGGTGFGPRHLSFHPLGRWAAVSVERHNELHVFAVEHDRFAPKPVWRMSTLQSPAAGGRDQLSSTVRFHPSGRFLYVVNRHDTSVYSDGSVPSDLSGNNIAVYAFDESDGRPVLLQHVPTESIHVRTFSLDSSGSLLVTASILPALAQCPGGVKRVPARLTFFRVAEDGCLTRVKVLDMDNERLSMFWSHLNGNAQIA